MLYSRRMKKPRGRMSPGAIRIPGPDRQALFQNEPELMIQGSESKILLSGLPRRHNEEKAKNV